MTMTCRIQATPMGGRPVRSIHNCSSPVRSVLTEITGPTPALTFHLLGIQLTSAQGATWSIAPVLSGLPSAEGGLSTGLGFFGVKWAVDGDTLTLTVQVPAGTEGVVTLPGSGPLTVNKSRLQSSSNSVELKGGNHTIARHV